MPCNLGTVKYRELKSGTDAGRYRTSSHTRDNAVTRAPHAVVRQNAAYPPPRDGEPVVSEPASLASVSNPRRGCGRCPRARSVD
eukprot:COSAG02_NODE_6_length_64796_cov_76.792865_11_plen_84_part_00